MIKVSQPPVLSLTVPVYNEEQILAQVVGDAIVALENLGVSFELILSENGSRDATRAIAETLAHNDPRVRWISLPQPDYGQAIRQGFLASSGECLAHFSADWMDFGFLSAALSEEQQFEIVIGTKASAPAVDRRPWTRRLGGRVFHGVEKGMFDLPVSDTHGLKVLRRSRVMPVIEKCKFGGEVFDTELVVRACRAGLRVREIAIHFEERRLSRSAVLGRAGRALIQLVGLRLALWHEDLR
jgi:hypothetical protein